MPTAHPMPRMYAWLLISILMLFAASCAQEFWPGTLIAVTLYKAQLMTLGGWGGYWLDRALFPYDRPHVYVEDEPPIDPLRPEASAIENMLIGAPPGLGDSMLRRAIIVAACLICVGLGA